MSSDFKVTLLGTGYPAPLMNRFGPSTLVEAGETRLLFDCGRGILQRIYQIDNNPTDFDKLFLTHLHSDHTTGIPDLWIGGYLYRRRNLPLRIWGPKGTKQMLEYIQKAYAVDLKVRSARTLETPKRIGLELHVNDITEGLVYDENDVKVTAFNVNHFYYTNEPSYGYRVDFDDRSVVISGDTCYCENLIQHSKNVDLLIHEVCAAPMNCDVPERYKAPMSHHTSPEECGRVFSAVKSKLAVFTHVIQFEGVSLEEMMERTRKEYSGPVIFGEDLMHIEVGEEVKVLNR